MVRPWLCRVYFKGGLCRIVYIHVHNIWVCAHACVLGETENGREGGESEDWRVR